MTGFPASELWRTYTSAFANSIDLYQKLYSASWNAFLSGTRAAGSTGTLTETEKTFSSKAREVFDSQFRNDQFVKALANAVNSYSKLAKANGFGQTYQQFSNLAAAWNNSFIEPFRDSMFRTPSHRVHSSGKFSLFHYDRENAAKQRTPLLVVYAFINRHYILDLLPNVSIIRNLMSQGIDVFATDWGTPGAYDKDLTIAHFVNAYMDSSIDKIMEHTGTDKVSLLGYCWGGDLALIYATLHPEKVQNVITLATPGDSSKDDGLLSVWTKAIDPDSLVDAFGNVPGALLNSAFALKSPLDFLHKYPHFFEKQRDLESLQEFFATEMWLYDSPPVIGEIYRMFVRDFYQKNLLVKNEAVLANDQKVDLRKITMPYLNIVAAKDDLVAPDSSKALNDVVASKDKSLIEFPSGHVGACISPSAHSELWPKVGKWLANRSELS